MMHSVRMSRSEAAVNVLVGFGAAVLTQMGVFPAAGLQVGIMAHLRRRPILTPPPILDSFLRRRLIEVFASLRSGTPPPGSAGPAADAPAVIRRSDRCARVRRPSRR
ncbi:MAG: hypothetical protein JWL84_4206 [Rhodospirillales bacterium]|jgi:hypothetical protein|nr:hypothetical protein [Rhodospirillales bacterium]